MRKVIDRPAFTTPPRGEAPAIVSRWADVEVHVSATTGTDDATPTARHSVSLGDRRFTARLTSTTEEHVVAVRIVADTYNVLSAELRRRFRLTEREAEVAVLLVERRSNKEIARRLRVSIHTAWRHTEKVLGKLGISSRRDVLWALQNRSA